MNVATENGDFYAISCRLSMKVVKLMLGALWAACFSYALFVVLVPGLVAPSSSRYYWCVASCATTFAWSRLFASRTPHYVYVWNIMKLCC